jgi:hypothetical protein
MRVRYMVLALALAGCAQSSASSPSAATPPGTALVTAPGDWLARATAAVRVSEDLQDTRDCEFVSVLQVPAGWDGDRKNMTPAEENALNEMKRATAQVGGNLVLLYPGPEPSGEAYLCTE